MRFSSAPQGVPLEPGTYEFRVAGAFNRRAWLDNTPIRPGRFRIDNPTTFSLEAGPGRAELARVEPDYRDPIMA